MSCCTKCNRNSSHVRRIPKRSGLHYEFTPTDEPRLDRVFRDGSEQFISSSAHLAGEGGADHTCCAPSGLGSVMVVLFPGRCPGLLCSAPLGLRNLATFLEVNILECGSLPPLFPGASLLARNRWSGGAKVRRPIFGHMDKVSALSRTTTLLACLPASLIEFFRRWADRLVELLLVLDVLGSLEGGSRE